VLHLEQRAKAALASAERAIELEPDDAYGHLVRARFLRIAGRRAEAQASLATTLELDPALAAAVAEQGYAALELGRIDIVDAAGREVLSLQADHSDGLVLVGHAQLARGDVEEAVQLALAALARSPTDLEALHLLASAKMKKNPIGGLWWRWNRFLVKLGQARAIFFVVGVWVAYRWAVLASRDLALPEVTGSLLSLAYLMFVLYTLSADTIVRRVVAKEVQRVRIRPSF
jgi:tetratricopeptide (TPR) repeat protein